MMTDLKFSILEEIYNACSLARINESEFLKSKGDASLKYKRAVWELRSAKYLDAVGDDLVLRPLGIAAMEEEIRQRKEREEDIQLQRDLAAEAARDAQKARRQEWIAIIVTALLSLAAFVKSFF